MNGRRIRFSDDGALCTISHQRRALGALALVFFGPVAYLLSVDPEGRESIPAWVFVGAVGLAVIWCLGFYRSSSFDRSSGRFSTSVGFFIPLRSLRGALSEIEALEFETHWTRGVRGGGRRRRMKYHDLHLVFQGRRICLASGDPELDRRVAERLGALIGCAVRDCK